MEFLANIRRVRTSLPYLSFSSSQPSPPLPSPPHGGLQGEGRGQPHLCSGPPAATAKAPAYGHPSTTHARGDGHPCGPHSVTPPAVQARGDRHQLTSQSQQQKEASAPHTVSAQARHVFNLYRECVSAGMWARLVIEQRPAGEYFSLSSRPSAAAPAAARDGKQPRKTRRPNKRRAEKKQLWQRSRGTFAAAASLGQQQQQNVAKTVRQRQHANASSQQLLSNATADCSSQLPQQAPVRAAPAARTRQPAVEGSRSPQQQQQTARRTWAAIPAVQLQPSGW